MIIVQCTTRKNSYCTELRKLQESVPGKMYWLACNGFVQEHGSSAPNSATWRICVALYSRWSLDLNLTESHEQHELASTGTQP